MVATGVAIPVICIKNVLSRSKISLDIWGEDVTLHGINMKKEDLIACTIGIFLIPFYLFQGDFFMPVFLISIFVLHGCYEKFIKNR